MNAAPPARPVACLRWPADAELTLPGSKSEANRLLVAAALSGRRVRISGATPSDDVQHMVAGLAMLGFEARFVEGQGDVVQVGPRTGTPPTSGELYCGNAGTTLRFLVSVAAITPGQWTLVGDDHMQHRTIAPLVQAWRQLGIAMLDSQGCPPVHVRGDAVAGGRVRLDAAISSQFVSSLLLVGAQLPAGLEIEFVGLIASAAYAQLTCDLLRRFGVAATLRPDGASVRAGRGTPADEFAVGGDWSAMGVWTCLASASGSRVRATNLHHDSGQADERLHAVLQDLAGDGDRTIDVATVPDQFPNLAIMASRRTGTTRLIGAANLRHKECDRIAVMARELTRVGVVARELADGLEVDGTRDVRPATIDPEADHRIAMAFALLGMLTPGLAIAAPDCVAKSYPAFWRDVEVVQRSRRCLVIVGMRAAGKSTLARAFAERTGVPNFDTDEQFIAQFGPIDDFVGQHGWPAFRAEEARLVAEALGPGRIVATGGGAIEDPATRDLLVAHSLVVWLDTPLALLRSRLSGDDAARPSVTGAGVLIELDALVAKRHPLYAAVATLRLDGTAPTAVQVDQLLLQLAALAPVRDAAEPSPGSAVD